MQSRYAHMRQARRETQPQSNFSSNLILLIALALFTPFIISVVSNLPFIIYIPCIAVLGFSLCSLAYSVYKSVQPQQSARARAAGEHIEEPRNILENQGFSNFLSSGIRVMFDNVKQFARNTAQAIHEGLSDADDPPTYTQDQHGDSASDPTTIRTERRTRSQTRNARRAGSDDRRSHHMFPEPPDDGVFRQARERAQGRDDAAPSAKSDKEKPTVLHRRK